MRMADILIVDDDIALCDAISDVLEATGHRVVIAHNGFEAIEQVNSLLFDLVLMDIWMAGMNGVEAYRRIKTIQPRMPAIMMTAYATPELLETALQEGAVNVLPKPMDMNELLALIQSTSQ